MSCDIFVAIVERPKNWRERLLQLNRPTCGLGEKEGDSDNKREITEKRVARRAWKLETTRSYEITLSG